MIKIIGIETPTSGKLTKDRKNITKLDASKRGMGIVFQNYALFPHMNIWENIAYGLRVEKLPQEEIIERMKVLKESIDSYEGGIVKVSSTAHPGVKLTISNAVYYVKNEISYCRFVKSEGDVKVESY